MNVLSPQVAGLFYPSEPARLTEEVKTLLSRAAGHGTGRAEWPKALIVPHAGYRYSAPVAAEGYALLAPGRERIRRVVLLGTGHRGPRHGLATTMRDALATPLGAVPIDSEGRQTALGFLQVSVEEIAFRGEHSLEVQLPFLQIVLSHFSVVPLLVGRASAGEVAEVLDALWGGPETLVVVSSDMTHYFDCDTARGRDQQTARAVVALRADDIPPDGFCCHGGVCGLVALAARRGMSAIAAALRNSGDTSGERESVVGYGAFAFYEPTVAR
ncbi:MAG: AmmeMemoRadiSam system protein B [Planctomycetia bacterium]|nr:AmmeMemoRadiSam system protein B [Planctomycetia bacterium]